jgi:hypothetical protein
MALASCCGQQVYGKDMLCVSCGAALALPGPKPIGSVPGIPVRRYGTVPPPPVHESTWEVESLSGPEPRTIAEYGGRAVFLAGVGAAAVAGCLIYLF